MQHESQYTDQYLATNARRSVRMGPGKGLTVSTYLAYNLKGKAKMYAGRYKFALERALDARVRNGSVTKDISAGGRTAYYYHGCLVFSNDKGWHYVSGAPIDFLPVYPTGVVVASRNSDCPSTVGESQTTAAGTVAYRSIDDMIRLER